MFDSKTKLLGIIGDPVEHTLSPVLHNFLLARAGLNYSYLAFRVKQEALQEALLGMRALGIQGLNVTIPHKEAVIPHLDKLSLEAEAIGAVNVISNEEGLLIGYNTDFQGFLLPLESRGVKLSGMRAVVVGAGGAAAAVVYALLLRKAKVTIVNRTISRAQRLAQRFSSLGEVEYRPWESLPKIIVDAELLAHATPVGMYPNVEEIPFSRRLLREGLLVYDLVYNPPETKLLSAAALCGAKGIGGLEMLVWQGIKALEIWTRYNFSDQDAKRAILHLKEVVSHG